MRRRRSARWLRREASEGVVLMTSPPPSPPPHSSSSVVVVVVGSFVSAAGDGAASSAFNFCCASTSRSRSSPAVNMLGGASFELVKCANSLICWSRMFSVVSEDIFLELNVLLRGVKDFVSSNARGISIFFKIKK